jgi:hypothetical protein
MLGDGDDDYAESVLMIMIDVQSEVTEWHLIRESFSVNR